MSDKPKVRRVYYDHEPAYQKIAEAGGEGWDDLRLVQRNDISDDAFGSYAALTTFLRSEHLPSPCKALEIGCGGGQASLLLAAHGFDVVGIDYSETAVELARANAERRGLDAEFYTGDVTKLDMLQDQSFGLVIDNHCLHCLVDQPDRDATLREVHRVLREGGIFFSETMSSEGHYTPSEMGVDPETGISEHHTRRWVSEEHFRVELEKAGLSVLALRREPQEPHTGDCLVVVATR